MGIGPGMLLDLQRRNIPIFLGVGIGIGIGR
jgi:hypothetical protein